MKKYNSFGQDPISSLEKRSKKGLVGYPIATIAYYGPDDQRASKVAVGILNEKNEVISMHKWFSEDSDIRNIRYVHEEILDYIKKQNVKSVTMPERIIGCPHEEGIDYPDDSECPQCLFWHNKDRWTGETIH